VAEIIIKVVAASRLKSTDKFTGRSRHEPTPDADRINHAVGKPSRYLYRRLGLLCDFWFPAYKHFSWLCQADRHAVWCECIVRKPWLHCISGFLQSSRISV